MFPSGAPSRARTRTSNVWVPAGFTIASIHLLNNPLCLMWHGLWFLFPAGRGFHERPYVVESTSPFNPMIPANCESTEDTASLPTRTNSPPFPPLAFVPVGHSLKRANASCVAGKLQQPDSARQIIPHTPLAGRFLQHFHHQLQSSFLFHFQQRMF